MLSVAILGARRRRQGTGEYVARYFARHGAAVRAVVGTTPGTVEEARAALAERYGIECRGYTSLEAMLEAEAVEAVAICTPIAAHRAGLEAAAGRGLHALCEKPIIYEPDRDMGAGVREIAGRFAAARRTLATVTQWPCTLEAFRRLYPDLDLSRVERFAMRLSPMGRGDTMLVDSLPHPISMLRALVGPGVARFRSISWAGEEAALVAFGYEHGRGRVEAEVRLERSAEQPRPASYAIDGREARREIRLADYAMSLVGGDRAVPLADPLERLVAEFIERAGRGEGPDVDGLASEAAALQAIVRGAVGAN